MTSERESPEAGIHSARDYWLSVRFSVSLHYITYQSHTAVVASQRGAKRTLRWRPLACPLLGVRQDEGARDHREREREKKGCDWYIVHCSSEDHIGVISG